MYKYIFLLGSIFLLSGCTSQQEGLKPPPPLKLQEIIVSETNITCATISEEKEKIFKPVLTPNELTIFPQTLSTYIEINNTDKPDLLNTQKNFFTFYYSPWSRVVPAAKIDDVTWALKAYTSGFGSNLKEVPTEWFDAIKEQSNFKMYGTLNYKAIAIKWMNLRAFPTSKPLYKDPSLPGEGFPFDLLQNSSVNYGEPLFVSHQSADGAWSYVFTNNVSGWVPTNGIKNISEIEIERIAQSEKVFIIDDQIPLYDENNHFVTYSRIGMVLPLLAEEEEYYLSAEFGEHNISKALRIPKKSARIGISKFSNQALLHIGEQMMKNTYGWGGMFEERDCSSMLRDMYTPFGIWLPRNSSSQARKGEVVSLDGLDNQEKLAQIRLKAIPFETIIYLKGHVLLYIGLYNDNVMVMHNLWGIRTKTNEGKKGRFVIGKAIISTLEIGSDLENFDIENKLLTRVQSMNIFTQSAVKPQATAVEIK